MFFKFVYYETIFNFYFWIVLSRSLSDIALLREGEEGLSSNLRSDKTSHFEEKNYFQSLSGTES